MAEWRHPYEDLLRMPLSAKEQLRGERMCAAAGTGYNPTSVLRPWRRRSHNLNLPLWRRTGGLQNPPERIPLPSHQK
jgi:hypothetical protein